MSVGARQRHRVAAVATRGHRRTEGKAEHAVGGQAAFLHQLSSVAGAERSVPFPVTAVEVGHVLHHRKDGHLRNEIMYE